MTPLPAPPTYDEQDPFDLPDWLGGAAVTWEAEAELGSTHRMRGALTSAGREPLACDLLAVDDAYPEPVAADALRVRAHQVWRHGEVLVAADGPRVLLVVPGSRLDLDTVIAALGRLARAVGARPGSYYLLIRIPTDR